MKKCFHILVLVSVLLLPGCNIDFGPEWGGTDMILTVRCDESPVTKAGDPETQDGEKRYNENLIRSVDFFFYPGTNPAGTEEAVHHIRRELTEDPMPVDGKWEVPFRLVVKKDIINMIFTTGNDNPADDNRATVYTLVNFDQSFIDTLSHSSMDYLASIRFVTDFAHNETEFKQPCFIMDGKKVLTYSDTDEWSVNERIDVKRFAAKVTVSIHVENPVVLSHRDDTHDPVETWVPVLHTMRVYLVDGVKSVYLGGNDTNPDYFTYAPQDVDTKRPFVKNDGADTPYVTPTTEGYYDTYPMYTYPLEWETNIQKDTAHLGGKYHEPYLKLEMDWTRVPDGHYTYDRRKYYYKVLLPFDKFERNHWYGLLLDVGILGSETDEGKALLDPSCYILDWQNITETLNKNAVISKARYLSVEKESWELNNIASTTIPFLSSHIVSIVTDSIKVTRPYYGQITTEIGRRVGDYHPELHAWIRQKEGTEEYYLDYIAKEGDPQRPPEDDEQYNPVHWLSNTSTSIVLDHDLQNDYRLTSFDYSPYTIDFYIVHSDLDSSTITYKQYLRHIKIVQYPAIYIESTRNSDFAIQIFGDKNSAIPCGYYPLSDQPWSTYPWGYVYVNGGRFLRQFSSKYPTSTDPRKDPYYNLVEESSQKEYQWQAVWYTGGSRDMFTINVTVLPSDSDFVIGDPRTKEVDNLGPTPNDPQRYASMYEFSAPNENDKGILGDSFASTATHPHYDENGSRTGFAYAPVAPSISNGDEGERTLSYYHPADKSNRTANMLAPSFRISSKFGGTEFGTISKEAAEWRCASYQEDGFPAGRWRLPTKAEIKFVVQLSANKAFERLFENLYYWSAHCAVRPDENANLSESNNPNNGAGALLRCVYDSWYWGDTQESQREVFYWGDKE